MFRHTPLRYAALVVLTSAALFQAFTAQYFGLEILTEILILAILVLALDIVAGFGGMVSLCHGALMGVGAYGYAVLSTKAGLTPPVAMAAAVGITASISWIIGAICSRSNGIYFIMATLAFGQMAYSYVFEAPIFGGDDGLGGIERLDLSFIGVDLNDDKEDWGRRFGMTHFINPKKIEGSVVQAIVDLTKTPFDKIGGADYSFDCTGNVKVMRDALECTHRGWGQSIIIGVAPAGAVIETRPFQLVTGRVWKGTAFGGARGRTDVPKIVDWYMEGKIEIDPMITHVLPLERINEGFDLMHAGKSIRAVVVY